MSEQDWEEVAEFIDDMKKQLTCMFDGDIAESYASAMKEFVEKSKPIVGQSEDRYHEMLESLNGAVIYVQRVCQSGKNA